MLTVSLELPVDELQVKHLKFQFTAENMKMKRMCRIASGEVIIRCEILQSGLKTKPGEPWVKKINIKIFARLLLRAFIHARGYAHETCTVWFCKLAGLLFQWRGPLPDAAVVSCCT